MSGDNEVELVDMELPEHSCRWPLEEIHLSILLGASAFCSQFFNFICLNNNKEKGTDFTIYVGNKRF